MILTVAISDAYIGTTINVKLSTTTITALQNMRIHTSLANIRANAQKNLGIVANKIKFFLPTTSIRTPPRTLAGIIKK